MKDFDGRIDSVRFTNTTLHTLPAWKRFLQRFGLWVAGLGDYAPPKVPYPADPTAPCWYVGKDGKWHKFDTVPVKAGESGPQGFLDGVRQ